jgi:hypothetical protein
MNANAACSSKDAVESWLYASIHTRWALIPSSSRTRPGGAPTSLQQRLFSSTEIGYSSDVDMTEEVMKLPIGLIARLALEYIVQPAIAKAVAKDKIEPGLPPKETVDVVKEAIGKEVLKGALKRIKL